VKSFFGRSGGVVLLVGVLFQAVDQGVEDRRTESVDVAPLAGSQSAQTFPEWARNSSMASYQVLASMENDLEQW